jgi:diacylglycerol kinase (ATP)
MSITPICVIGNPAAARGKMASRLRCVKRMLGDHAHFQFSEAPGHAEELALAATRDYATVVAAGGDGTVHEVANGILSANAPYVAFGVIPLGSGNDYAAGLQTPTDLGELCDNLLNGTTAPVDVGEVTDNRGRKRFFVNTLGLGLSGAVTWESQRIKGLRGLALYGLAAIRAIQRHFHTLETTLTLDSFRIELPTLYLAVALGQREGGGFIVAPKAKLDDGLFDYLHAGRLTRWQALGYLPRMALGWLPDNDPLIRRGQCRELVVESKTAMIVHADGEIFAHPADDVRRIHIRMLPRRLRIKGRSGTKDWE